MNLSMWTSIREYIAAEVRLGIARHQRDVHDEAGTGGEIAALEEQSTRMETDVRRLMELEQQDTANAIRRASFGPPKLR
jgi:hypothetical protein